MKVDTGGRAARGVCGDFTRRARTGEAIKVPRGRSFVLLRVAESPRAAQFSRRRWVFPTFGLFVDIELRAARGSRSGSQPLGYLGPKYPTFGLFLGYFGRKMKKTRLKIDVCSFAHLTSARDRWCPRVLYPPGPRPGPYTRAGVARSLFVLQNPRSMSGNPGYFNWFPLLRTTKFFHPPPFRVKFSPKIARKCGRDQAGICTHRVPT